MRSFLLLCAMGYSRCVGYWQSHSELVVVCLQHMDYVISAANLRANVYAVSKPDNNRDPALFKTMLAAVTVPEFVPKVSCCGSCRSICVSLVLNLCLPRTHG